MENNLITVTSPLLPDLQEFTAELQKIWESKWITNNGSYHKKLEAALADYLGVPYVSLFTNGTLPLITALQALRITGEVITTPYSFVATTHALWWNGIKPVFVDVDPHTGNLDPDKIEAAITPKTTAIMPVHVYGNPCDTLRIQEIADRYGLKVIYDAAHAFGVRIWRPTPNPSLKEGDVNPAIYNTADPSLYKLLKVYSEEMRENPTEAESALWNYLKGKNLDAKFRRQHIIGDFIVDFVCLDKQLVIEIDGEYHNEWEQKIDDWKRTQWLESKGFTIIRFTNQEVLANTEAVIKAIKESLSSPLRGTGSGSVSSSPLRGDKRGADGAWYSILNAGDLSTISFHATKVYNTIEGGAMIMHDAQTKQRIDYLKNFGFANEVTVVGPGINSKMDEIRSAYGLINLKQVDKAIEARHQVALRYRKALREVEGISFFDDLPGVKHNYIYFPIFVDAARYGISRDELYAKMKAANVLGRRYFYPLISDFSTYRGLESARPENLPNAHRLASTVICLPIHHGLTDEDVQRVLDCIVK